MKLLLSQIQHAMQAVGDIPEGCDNEVPGICTDSRLLRAGELFFCLAGEHFDGHNFIEQAVRAGACGIVACIPQPEVSGVPVLMVPDTLQALGRLAHCWRKQTAATVIAITGSAGKTTVKELLAAILMEKGQTAKNKGNLNNEIGVPVSILQTTGTEDFWVLELGINQPGEMERLAAMVRPDMAVIHNIGPVHLEGLGDKEGVARAKTALLHYLPPAGQACVSMDYEALWDCAHNTQISLQSLTGFSTTTKTARFYGEYAGTGTSGGRYRLNLDKTALEVTLPLDGDYLAENVLAAATAAWQLGATAQQIQQGLARVKVPEHRLHTQHWQDWLLIDDSYNANPLSMKRAINSANSLSVGKKVPLVLVLGEMAELGKHRVQEHYRLGQHIARSAASSVFYKGNSCDEVLRGLTEQNWQGSLIPLAGVEAFPSQLAALGLHGGIILFKGSRSVAMEKFYQQLIQGPARQPQKNRPQQCASKLLLSIKTRQDKEETRA